MPRKSPWVKKRGSRTAKAASQQKHRRKNTIFKRRKADTMVAIRTRKNWRELYLDSATGGKWLGTLSRLENMYVITRQPRRRNRTNLRCPRPTPVTMEDIFPAF